ncbi:MAG: thioredoxin family protein [Kiritimatiellales bacterium]|nr:thioredoxin family protein [Kiritimatiellota bacterium]MBL7012266.1 thioredoxin family protein [Kiritimatiellales bacterium]
MKKLLTCLAILGFAVAIAGCSEPAYEDGTSQEYSDMPLETPATGDGWLTDFEAAKQLATEKGLPILADFSGSDWCGWCIRLDKEVFSQDEFKAYAEGSVVLFLADFPQTKPQSEEVKMQNEALAEKYGIRGFPTVLLLDAEGNVLERTGYQPGGAEKYVEHIKDLLK